MLLEVLEKMPPVVLSLMVHQRVPAEVLQRMALARLDQMAPAPSVQQGLHRRMASESAWVSAMVWALQREVPAPQKVH